MVLARLPIHWADASKSAQLEWEKWIGLFEVALMAENNISTTELTKTTGPKETSLMSDLEEATATKKAISVLYVAFGITARETIADKFPTTSIARITI